MLGLYPESGPYSRDKYPRHLEFFAHGAEYNERLMMAANRVGKTHGVGAYELSCHLTGFYPHWWQGKRFSTSILAWAASNTSVSTKNTVQMALFGGTGLHANYRSIPDKLVTKKVSKMGISGAYEEVYVRHASGGTSIVQFKSYDQGRERFQGARVDYVWCDEEPPLDVYLECLQRTMAVGDRQSGMLTVTFTPLMGMSDVVTMFLDSKSDAKRKVVNATWDDVPHISKDEKERLWSSLSEYDREARSKGIPQVSSGLVYPLPRSDVSVTDFVIPSHWRKVFSLDVGWKNTAVLWACINPNDGLIYLYSEYLQGFREVSVHAQAIRARGVLQGVVDPAAGGRSIADGACVMDLYTDSGLTLYKANNAVDAGLWKVFELLSSGRVKVFSSLTQFWTEYGTYRRDDRGRVIKKNDHLMDCLRYLVMSGVDLFSSAAVSQQASSSYHEFAS